VLDVLLVEQHAEAPVAVAGAVVGEDAADGEAEAGEVGSAHVEEALGRGAGLVGQDGREADPAVIVDGDVQVLVTRAARFAATVAVDAVAGLDDPGQAFDIEVDEATGTLVLVAHHRGRRVQGSQPVHARTAQDAAHRGAAQPEGHGDPKTVVAQPAKGKNLLGQGRSGKPWGTQRA